MNGSSYTKIPAPILSVQSPVSAALDVARHDVGLVLQTALPAPLATLDLGTAPQLAALGVGADNHDLDLKIVEVLLVGYRERRTRGLRADQLGY